MKKDRYTIGLLVSGIIDNFTAQLCRGVQRAAEELDMDVVVLPGKYLYRDLSRTPEYRYEYQYGTVFSHIRKENVDGLIIAAGCIGCMTSEKKLLGFLEQYREIPSVLVASNLAEYTCISYDNKNAVSEGIEYMIKQAGCRYICILDGPDGNTDAQERKEACLKTLQKHGLPFLAKMSVQGDLSESATTREAVADLILDNPRMDGLFCVNDAMAYCAYEVMRKLGIRPGIDVKILGYDNEQRSLTMDPPLATVSADPVLLGIRAVESIQKKIMGEPMEDIVIPSRFVLRDSLGGPETVISKRKGAAGEDLWEDFTRIFNRYINRVGRDAAQDAFREFSELMELVRSALDENMLLSLTKPKILKRLEDFFRTDAMVYMDLDELMFYIERQSRKSLEKHKHDAEDVAEVRGLFADIYRRLVLAVDKRYAAMVRENEFVKEEMRHFVRETDNFRSGADSSYLSFLNYLDWLKIKNAFLYMFTETVSLKDGPEFPEQDFYELVAARRDNSVRLVSTLHRRVYQEELFDNREIGAERYFMVLLPLYFGEENYGLLLCDLSEGMYEEGEFVVSQLGAAAHMLHILRENEAIQKRLKIHLEETKQENTQLDQLSKSDELTGLFNRRGFMEAAGLLMARCRGERKNCLVAYIDMNNLKIVNDRFGHDDGDFALQTIAQILKDTIPEDAVSGRIGGDEFACAMIGDPDFGERFTKQLLGAFDTFNQNSDKPYLVSASVGIYPVDPQEMTPLEAAMNLADERLYIAKQKKDPRILKDEI